MKAINDYLREISVLKYYLIISSVVFILSYSVFFLFNTNTLYYLGKEDAFIEWLTAIFFITSSSIFFIAFIKTRNVFFLLLSVAMFIGAGEEISWGQRIINFRTPNRIEEINVQNEFNLHNLDIFSHIDSKGNAKHGLYRLLEFKLLFKLFTLLFCVVLPLSVYHFKTILSITAKVKLPVPPVTIGIFFILNWIITRLFSLYLTNEKELYALAEMWECLAGFILLMISLYFLNQVKITKWGFDIKQILS